MNRYTFCNYPSSQNIITKKRPIACYIDFTVVKIEIFGYFYYLDHNVDRGYTLEPLCRGGSNEYPQSVFWIKHRKSRFTPANPSFFSI